MYEKFLQNYGKKNDENWWKKTRENEFYTNIVDYQYIVLKIAEIKYCICYISSIY